jgi:peptidyl-prolyl cis-trans isomerase B (cyclophilin B)
MLKTIFMTGILGIFAATSTFAETTDSPQKNQATPVETKKVKSETPKAETNAAKQAKTSKSEAGAKTTATKIDPKSKVKHPMVILETSKGTIEIELWEDKAPKTVKNFLQYAEKGFFDGTIFHRVIGNFMIQGGGFLPKMVQKPTDKPIENEASPDVSNNKYTVAMARTNDPNSATSQFFINVTDNAFLNKSANNPGYAVFGKVIKGTEVVDAIKAVKTATKGGHGDVPVEDVVIKKATVKKASA